jgi:hypothetical protein
MNLHGTNYAPFPSSRMTTAVAAASHTGAQGQLPNVPSDAAAIDDLQTQIHIEVVRFNVQLWY